jgi:hypothetical protein
MAWQNAENGMKDLAVVRKRGLAPSQNNDKHSKKCIPARCLSPFLNHATDFLAQSTLE